MPKDTVSSADRPIAAAGGAFFFEPGPPSIKLTRSPNNCWKNSFLVSFKYIKRTPNEESSHVKALRSADAPLVAVLFFAALFSLLITSNY